MAQLLCQIPVFLNQSKQISFTILILLIWKFLMKLLTVFQKPIIKITFALNLNF